MWLGCVLFLWRKTTYFGPNETLNVVLIQNEVTINCYANILWKYSHIFCEIMYKHIQEVKNVFKDTYELIRVKKGGDKMNKHMECRDRREER